MGAPRYRKDAITHSKEKEKSVSEGIGKAVSQNGTSVHRSKKTTREYRVALAVVTALAFWTRFHSINFPDQVV